VIVGLFLLRGPIGRGPVVAALFFVGTLFPALGFIDVYPMKFSFVADHFQYLASIGPLTLFAAVGKAALERIFRNRPGMPALVGTGWLAVLGVLTWSQISIYESRETLWTDTLAKNPDSPLVHQSLGEIEYGKFERSGYRDREALDEARKHYAEVIRTSPNEASPRYGLGKTYWAVGDKEQAEKYFAEAVRLKPDFKEARYNLGNMYLQKGRFDEAIEQYEKAVAVWPDFADAHANLGIALVARHRFADAIPHFRAAIALQPSKKEMLMALAGALKEVGQGEEARAIAERLLREHPGEEKYRKLLEDVK
jgi:tetratricopeptide (TPR) repeat protein